MREVSKVNSLLNTIYKKAQSLSDISNAERGRPTHRRGYTGESEERGIWWASRHGWTKGVWVAVRTSFHSSGSERSANYRIRKQTQLRHLQVREGTLDGTLGPKPIRVNTG